MRLLLVTGATVHWRSLVLEADRAELVFKAILAVVQLAV
jgi:hypothetical protein